MQNDDFAGLTDHFLNDCETGNFFTKGVEKYAIKMYIYKILLEMKWREQHEGKCCRSIRICG